MPLPIPDEQLQRIQPILNALLADLRQRTQTLTPDIDLALQYHPEAGS